MSPNTHDELHSRRPEPDETSIKSRVTKMMSISELSQPNQSPSPWRSELHKVPATVEAHLIGTPHSMHQLPTTASSAPMASPFKMERATTA